MSNLPLISVVTPEYNGEKMVHELVDRIKKSVSTITDNFEIILVNDSSPDNAWEEIRKECALDERVIGLDLSKNYGQHYAISAGLAYARGEWIIVMDCDLQDIPEEIPNLYAKAQEGYDIVMVRRVVKHVGWWKDHSSIWFHSVLSFLSGVPSDPSLSNYSILHRKVVNQINRLPQKARSYGSILNLLGFKKAYIELEQAARGEGHSGYTLRKMFNLAMDIIIATTNRPLRLAVILGFTMSLFSFLLAVYNVFAKLVGIIDISGYTSTIFSIWFVGGLLLFVMGILGLYIGKIFDQVKGQPLYIVRESINAKED